MSASAPFLITLGATRGNANSTSLVTLRGASLSALGWLQTGFYLLWRR